MDIVVFRHQQSVGLGSLEATLHANDLAWRYADLFAEDISDFAPESPKLLIVLGGAPSAYQTEDFPFIAEEIRIVKARLEKDLPILGICLGAQIMSAALGAKVYAGEQGAELGWSPLHLTHEGENSAVSHLGKEKTNMFHWHGDTFDLPEGATLLASSEKYKHQAYAWGENALAVQAHPEMTATALEEWLISKAGDVSRGKLSADTMRKEMEEYGPVLYRQANAFLQSWLEQVDII